MGFSPQVPENLLLGPNNEELTPTPLVRHTNQPHVTEKKHLSCCTQFFSRKKNFRGRLLHRFAMRNFKGPNSCFVYVVKRGRRSIRKGVCFCARNFSTATRQFQQIIDSFRQFSTVFNSFQQFPKIVEIF